MYQNKFMLCVFGGNRVSVIKRLEPFLSEKVTHSHYDFCDIFVNERYYTGIPSKPVWKDGIGLLLHGIVFPWGISLDELSDNPVPYIEKTIDKFRNNLGHIARGFRNGSYAGIVIDTSKNTLYFFTCFLNTIPVYYTHYDDGLIVSTDLYLLTKITGKSSLELTSGLIEYYIEGTNLSGRTPFEHIKSIPKGGYIKYNHNSGKIDIDYYYIMPEEETGKKFDYYVDEFANLWESTIHSLHSKKFRYGLGLTGGLDSRLIFSAMEDKKTPLFFTGSHPDHPDYLLASKITKFFNLSNHFLEDYRYSDKLYGYAEYKCLADNPLTNNSLYYMDQARFRINNNLTYEMAGGTPFVKGSYHYRDSKSVFSHLKMMLPLNKTPIHLSDYARYRLLIKLCLKTNVLLEDASWFSHLSDYTYLPDSLLDNFIKQIGQIDCEESFMERFRHIYKNSNLMSWCILGSRRFLQYLEPSMNIEMTDFACRTPLRYRENKRLVFTYLQRYHPETARFVLSGYFLSAKSPWLLYRTLSPMIRIINYLGIKIPILQWYHRKHDYKVISNMAEVYDFQRLVCKKSYFIKSTPFKQINDFFKNDKIRLMRVFNIAVLEKKLELGEDGLRDYLLDKVNEVRSSNR